MLTVKLKKLDQTGLVPLLVVILIVVAAVIYFAYTRVLQAQQ